LAERNDLVDPELRDAVEARQQDDGVEAVETQPRRRRLEGLAALLSGREIPSIIYIAIS